MRSLPIWSIVAPFHSLSKAFRSQSKSPSSTCCIAPPGMLITIIGMLPDRQQFVSPDDMGELCDKLSGRTRAFDFSGPVVPLRHHDIAPPGSLATDLRYPSFHITIVATGHPGHFWAAQARK